MAYPPSIDQIAEFFKNYKFPDGCYDSAPSHRDVVEDGKFCVVTTFRFQDSSELQSAVGDPGSRCYSHDMYTVHVRRLQNSINRLFTDVTWPGVIPELDHGSSSSDGVAPYGQSILSFVDDVVSETFAAPRNGYVNSYKARVAVYLDGHVQIDLEFLESEKISAWPNMLNPIFRTRESQLLPPATMPTTNVCTVYLDTVITTPSLLTQHKSSYRKPYDEARARAGVSACGPKEADVLLFNDFGEIMETSLSCVYFWRHEKWVTPSLSTGCNNSVTKLWSIFQDLCSSEDVFIEDISNGELVWLSNGVRGFFPGQVNLRYQMPTAEVFLATKAARISHPGHEPQNSPKAAAVKPRVEYQIRSQRTPEEVLSSSCTSFNHLQPGCDHRVSSVRPSSGSNNPDAGGQRKVTAHKHIIFSKTKVNCP